MATTTGMMHQLAIQDEFENWIIEAKLKIRFNTATYFIEKKKENSTIPLLGMVGFGKEKNNSPCCYKSPRISHWSCRNIY
jgi:hypothetical protein